MHEYQETNPPKENAPDVSNAQPALQSATSTTALSKMNGTVSEVVRLNDFLIVLRIKPDGGVPDFKAGQYVSVGLSGLAPRRPSDLLKDENLKDPGKIIERAYSIASSPDQKDHLEFCISIIPDGGLTSRLALLESGDRIFARSKIVGNFHIYEDKQKERIPDDKNLVFVATGTGIAPFMSMLRSAATWTSGRQITLVHGVRYAADLAYREELKELAARNPNFSYVACVSREDATDGIVKGRINKAFESGAVKIDASTDHILLCGNPEMIEGPNSLTNELLKQGFVERAKAAPGGNLLYEKYW
jgi:ferredoxin--NADP+ reductase